MSGQSRKWMILVATTWIQAFTGTNFDFSSYSSDLKSVLGISQVQLNYLAMASDMGKAFGWCSGLSLMHFPLWVVLLMAAFMGLFGYGLQWLLIAKVISLPYFLVFLLCLIAGCSICWFNTVCYVLCIRNFTDNRALALSLTISFNGVTAAIYTLIANAVDPESNSIYLLLNAVLPLLVSGLTLPPMLHQSPPQRLSYEAANRDSSIFLIFNILAIITGLYLLLLNSLSSVASTASILLSGAILLLVLPLCLPGVVCERNWAWHAIRAILPSNGSGYNLVDNDDLELVKELVEIENNGGDDSLNMTEKEECFSAFESLVEKDELTMLGEEHPARVLVCKLDFWLYYMAYFCGATLGLVYSNNLGQIAQSLGYYSELSSLITLYSSCSFFGRLLSAAPDFLREKVYFARTGWLTVALVPTPIAFFLLVASGSESVLRACTAMVGISSGFVFSAAVSVTSELFGPNSAGVNHNILITNIPIGSLLYGLVAALVYDSNGGSTSLLDLLGKEMVCMGRQCYLKTFIAWGCISLVGLVSSSVLFLRTKDAYDRLEKSQNLNQSSA